jgi:prophage regulatory protein
MKMQTSNEVRLWPLVEVMARTSRRKSAIYADISAGRFPRPVPVGAHRRAWISTEIEQWIAERIAERDARGTVAHG